MKNNTEREILVVLQGELHYVIKCIHVQVSCGEEKKNCHDSCYTQGHDKIETFYQTLQSKLQGKVIQPSNIVDRQMFVDLQTKLLKVTEEYFGLCVTCMR